MRTAIKRLTLAVALCIAAAAHAQVPADAPAGTNGLCKDGTYSSNATKKGACKGHKGVKEWYAATDAKTKEGKEKAPAAAAAPATKAEAAPAAAPAAPAAAAPAPAAAPATAPAPAKAASKAAAPGGGPGLVWVNSASKVYHCQGDAWYGKTKEGAYLSEAAAKSQGNRPAAGKSCS